MGLDTSRNGKETEGQCENLELHFGFRSENEMVKLFLMGCRPVLWCRDIERFDVSLTEVDEAFKAKKLSRTKLESSRPLHSPLGTPG